MLKEQPTSQPTRKVAGGGLAGALVTAVLGIGGFDLEPAVVAALTTLVAFAASWFVKDRA